MRLLYLNSSGELAWSVFSSNIPRYAILSHTWDVDEFLYEDLMKSTSKSKTGYSKILFCGEQAARDELKYFWVDTCCIDKWNLRELSNEINSMFRYYQNAAKCYVLLSDVPGPSTADASLDESTWKASFRQSKWFTRGWTLQELIAPALVEFFSSEHRKLGDGESLEQEIHEITGIPKEVLRGHPLDKFDVKERMKWAENRQTTEEEDGAYSLLGIFSVQMPLLYGEGRTEALRRLRQEIDSPQTTPFLIPFDRNAEFIGRELQLAQLEECLFVEGQTPKMAITGVSGTGKTQLALELAYRTRQKYKDCLVLWIPATDIESVHQAYSHIAQRLSIPGWDNEELDAKKLVQLHLSKKSTGQWLLIFDSADDVGLWVAGSESRAGAIGLIEYLPTSQQGCIIFTTRDKRTADRLTPQSIVEVPSMDPDIAQKMLGKRLSNRGVTIEPQKADFLLKELAYFPLAIELASAYINANNLTLEEYRALLAKQDGETVRFLSLEFQDEWQVLGGKHPLVTTWLISFEHIRSLDNKLAADYLSFIACVDPRDVPLSLLPMGQSQEEEKDAVRILKDYSIISRRPAGSALDMHQLVHLATRNWLQKQNSLGQQTEAAITHLHDTFPDDSHWNRSKWRRILPHANHALQSGLTEENNSARIGLLWKCAMSYQADGQIKKAVELLEHVLTIRERTLAEEHPDRLVSQYELTRAYQADGQIKKALELLEHVVTIRERALAEEHPDRLASQYELARAYHADGQIKKAVELLEHVVAVWERTLAEEHTDRLASQYELARAYQADGQIKKAVELLEHVVAVWERILVEEHPDRLASQDGLARAYHADGQIKKAVELLEHVVAIWERILAEEHPSRLTSQHELARVYQADGQIKKAVELLEHIVAVESRTLAEEHPDRLSSQYGLARAYQADGQIKKAVELLEHVVAVESRTLAEEHPYRLLSQYELARAYQANGQIKKAVELLEHVVTIRERTLAEEHPDQLASQDGLARAYQADGQIKKAVELIEHVVNIRERTLAEEHPDRLSSQHGLAGAYQADGQIKKAVELMEHVVAIRERILAEEHPSRLASRRDLQNLERHIQQSSTPPTSS